MYQQVTFSMFVDAFHKTGRYDQFCAYHQDGKPVGAYDALRVIYDYLEETQDDPYDLDVIAICCEFSHDTATEIADQYGLNIYGDASEDEIRNSNREDEINAIVREYLEDQGAYVGETEYGFVYLQH